MTALTALDARAPADEGHLVDESEIPTTELVKDAINQAKELTKLEIALAKDEMMREIAGFKSAAIMLGVSARSRHRGNHAAHRPPRRCSSAICTSRSASASPSSRPPPSAPPRAGAASPRNPWVSPPTGCKPTCAT